MKEYNQQIAITKKGKMFIFDDVVDFEQNIHDIDDELLAVGDVPYIIELLRSGSETSHYMEKIIDVVEKYTQPMIQS